MRPQFLFSAKTSNNKGLTRTEDLLYPRHVLTRMHSLKFHNYPYGVLLLLSLMDENTEV